MTWRDRAKCAGMNDAWWQLTIETQKAMCAECPVTADCLAEGTANKELGVWGGQLLQRTSQSKRVGPRPCKRCGGLYDSHRRNYCSRECMVAAQFEREDAQRKSVSCRWCGDPVKGGEYHDEGFCGWPCRRAFQRARTAEAIA